MIEEIYIEAESRVNVAKVDLKTNSVELVSRPEGILGNGYGYFKKVNGEEKFIALFTDGEFLYFFYDRPIRIQNDGTWHAELKEGFFKNQFTLKKSGELFVELDYRPGSYDAGVMEDLADLLSKPSARIEAIDKLVELLAESDPVKRKAIDDRAR